MQVCGGYIYIPARPGLTLASLANSLVDDLRLLQIEPYHFTISGASSYAEIADVAEWATKSPTDSLVYAGGWNDPDPSGGYSFTLTLEEWNVNFYLIDILYTRGAGKHLREARDLPSVAAFWQMWQNMCERNQALGGYLSKESYFYEGDEYRDKFGALLEKRDFEEMWNYLELFLLTYFSPKLVTSLPTHPPVFPVTMIPSSSGGLFIEG